MGDTTQGTTRRRSPTAPELATWRDYLETSEAVRRALWADLQASSGLSSGDYTVMLALSEAPDRRLRSSDLAEVAGWERSRLSHHLRRMEERGLVARGPVGGDARGAAVTLTDDGARLFRSASAAHLRLVREVFVDAFSADELERVAVLTTRLRAHLDTRRRASEPST
jgi:DNA-binding MarR family transcriptional regulator